jgi:hypothetical protein
MSSHFYTSFSNVERFTIFNTLHAILLVFSGFIHSVAVFFKVLYLTLPLLLLSLSLNQSDSYLSIRSIKTSSVAPTITKRYSPKIQVAQKKVAEKEEK